MRNCAHRRAHPPGRNGEASARSLAPAGASADEPGGNSVLTAGSRPGESGLGKFVGLVAIG
eukprot:3919166-Alexandrium_andersonii.AAC.1